MLTTGITELPNGLAEAREAMERVGEAITAEMEKKISMLAVLGTLGPMIGLLGTLKGMIASFSVIARSDVQLKASEVAGGISEALVLTFEGVALVGAGHLLLRPVPQPRGLHRHLGDADGRPVPAAFLPRGPGEGLGRRAGDQAHDIKPRWSRRVTRSRRAWQDKLSQDVKAEPNLTPILDMVFQLITFFMLVINFKSAELDLSLMLPVVGSARPVETHGQRGLLVLNIDNAGNLKIYGRSIKDIEGYIAKEANASRMAARIDAGRHRGGQDLPTTVVIRADRATPFQDAQSGDQGLPGQRLSQVRPEGHEQGSLRWAEEGRRRSQSEVELNLAAMLDMAFQLLTFFHSDVSAGADRRADFAAASAAAAGGGGQQTPQKAGQDVDNTNPVQGVNTLTISVFADPKTGEIQSLGVGETPVPGIAALDGKLKEVFADPGNPFDQVIIQVSDACRYDELMKVVDVCTHQVLPDGQKLSKLSFVELPSG